MSKPSQSIKNTAFSRTSQIAWTLGKSGAAWFGHKLAQSLSREQTKRSKKDFDLGFLIKQAEMAVDTLGKLKGTAMKAGQMFAVLGESYFPPELTRIFKKLQSQSPPLDWTLMSKTIKRRLGPNNFEKFQFNPIPIGSASLGQVYRAHWIEKNIDVAFKVQYPGVAKSVDSDLAVIKTIFKFTKLMPDPENFDELFEELKLVFKRELNYELEASQANYFRKQLHNEPFFKVPDIFEEFSSKKILCMTYEPGINFDEMLALNIDQEEKNRLATKILELYFNEFFVWGRMQTDPHFGNYLIRIDEQRNLIRNMILLDFGAVREFSPVFLENYRSFVWATMNQDRAAMIEAAERMLFIKTNDPQDHVDRILKLADTIMEPFLNTENGFYDFGSTDVHKRLIDLGVRTANASAWRAPPREVLFLHRKLSGVFTMLFALKARIRTKDILYKYHVKEDL